MTITTILARLKTCHAELTITQNNVTSAAFTRVFLRQPQMVVGKQDLPAVWAKPGRMVRAAPATSAGQAAIVREYVVTVLIAQEDEASTESLNDGDPKMGAVDAYIDAYIDYLLAHPRLATTAGGYLNDIAAEDTQFQDGGSTTITGPGGSKYAGFQMTLTISERRYPSPQRLA
jgi:hypothetical protein